MKNRRRSKNASECSQRPRAQPASKSLHFLKFSRTICRFSGTESGPIQDNLESAGSVPNPGQLNGSDPANNLDPNALAGLDTLLQELQNPNASNNTVSTPSPDSFDFSRSPTQIGENVAQVAATALNEPSQPGAPDDHYAFAGIAFSVRLFPSIYPRFIYGPPRVDSSAVLGLRRLYRNSNTTFPTRRSWHSCSLTTSRGHRLIGFFASSIGHVSRAAIARTHPASCHRLSILSPCCPSLARRHCNSYQKLMTMCVLPLDFTSVRVFKKQNRIPCLLVMHLGGRSCSNA